MPQFSTFNGTSESDEDANYMYQISSFVSSEYLRVLESAKYHIIYQYDARQTTTSNSDRKERRAEPTTYPSNVPPGSPFNMFSMRGQLNEMLSSSPLDSMDPTNHQALLEQLREQMESGMRGPQMGMGMKDHTSTSSTSFRSSSSTGFHPSPPMTSSTSNRTFGGGQEQFGTTFPAFGGGQESFHSSSFSSTSGMPDGIRVEGIHVQPPSTTFQQQESGNTRENINFRPRTPGGQTFTTGPIDLNAPSPGVRVYTYSSKTTHPPFADEMNQSASNSSSTTYTTSSRSSTPFTHTFRPTPVNLTTEEGFRSMREQMMAQGGLGASGFGLMPDRIGGIEFRTVTPGGTRSFYSSSRSGGSSSSSTRMEEQFRSASRTGFTAGGF